MKKRVFALYLAAFLVLTAFAGSAAAENIDTRTLATINKPGVVLVQTLWTADVTWSEFSFYDGFEEDLQYEVTRMVEDGEIAATEEAILHAMVTLMADYMEYYAFYTGNATTEQMSTAAVGTGFIVTPDGYLVTNAHVVHTNEDELYMSFARSSLESYATEAADEFEAEMRRSGYQLSEEEWLGIANGVYRMLSQGMEINNLQTSYKAFIGNVSPGSDVTAKGKGMDLRKMGEPIPGRDVAILKMEGNNLPTVTVGDDSKLRTGDRVYAMGYPAVATLSETLNVAQAIQEPTLTQGIISARKEMAGGWSILQTDAAIHGGNSGGPLFNEAGEVIGINTFGMLDSSSGAQVAGMNFAVPISIAKQFLHEINVVPTESTFTASFKTALTAYNSGDYHKALEILRGINETNPGFPVVQELLAEAREGADTNPVKTPEAASEETISKPTKGSSGLSPLIYIGGGLLLVIIVVLVVLLAKKKKPAAASFQPPTYNKPQEQPHAIGHQHTNHCAKCGAGMSADAKFCNACGTPVSTKESLHCNTCGHENLPGTKFCEKCGSKL